MGIEEVHFELDNAESGGNEVRVLLLLRAAVPSFHYCVLCVTSLCYHGSLALTYLMFLCGIMIEVIQHNQPIESVE